MLSDLNERLMRAKNRLRLKCKLESMLQQARKDVRDEDKKCSVLRKRLAAEQADVDKLEGLSLAGLFYSVLGTKDEKIEVERREFLAAKLKHDESLELLRDAKQEVERLETKLEPLADVDSEYGHLLQEKESVLTTGDDSKAQRLMEMSEQLADLEFDRNDIREAIAAGETALNALKQVKAALGSAANWGTWDMLGGGMISTMVKHSKIDTAKQHAHHAQQLLRRFQAELADTNERLHMSLEIGGFSKFADFFFDGLIADWVVQSKVSEASSACSRTISSVFSAVDRCQRKLAETEQEIEALRQRRRDFIEKA